MLFPGREKVMVKTLKDQKKYPMTMEDEAGFSPFCLRGKRSLITWFVVQEEGKYKNIKILIAFRAESKRKTKCSLPMGSDIIFMKSWEPIPVRSGHTNGVHSPSGRPMRCGSAWQAILTTGMEGCTPWKSMRNPVSLNFSYPR